MNEPKKITIKSRYGMQVIWEEKLPKARLMWRGAGIEIYGVGSFAGTAYECAANLAMNYCQSIHIPVSSLRRAD